MSSMFDKKRAQAKYFEETARVERELSCFSLEEKKYKSPRHMDSRIPKDGIGGIPITWDAENRVVYVDQTDSHSLIIGPTGSKKSRLVAIPAVKLLGYAKESMIISDPKAEIYNRTSSQLTDLGYDIGVLNLRSPVYGATWNPLSIPYHFYCKGDFDRANEFVNDIAENLTKSDASTKDPFWDNSAGSLFFGLALLLFKYCKSFDIPANCVHIGNLMNLRKIMFTRASSGQNNLLWDYAKKDEFIATALIGTVETANDTRAGILTVFDEKMTNFSIQPNLLNMLSANTLPLETIGEKPTAIFLILPDEKTSYHKLISLFIKQSYEYMIYKAQKEIHDDGLNTGKMKIRVNYVLDEFSSLPTIKDFPAMITAARSRKIRFNLFIQSKHQLLLRYNEETETIQANCNNWIYLSSRELKLLEELSSLCGNIYGEGMTRPVLSISELQRFDKERGEVLVLYGRKKPVLSLLPDIAQYEKEEKSQSVSIEKNSNVRGDLIDFQLAIDAMKEEKRAIIQRALGDKTPSLTSTSPPLPQESASVGKIMHEHETVPFGSIKSGKEKRDFSDFAMEIDDVLSDDTKPE